jgi:hypothetical protein
LYLASFLFSTIVAAETDSLIAPIPNEPHNHHLQ